MKKVFIKCVFKKNLGDDIFVSLLVERYKKTQFYLINSKGGGILPKSKNLKIININSFIYRIIRKVCYIFNIRPLLDTLYIKCCKYVVSIGGSIFMENKDINFKKDDSLFWYDKLKRKYFILGANIGPVYTDEYVNKVKEIAIKKAEDVCLRDKKSYSYFSDLSNVRYASDIVFSLNTNKYINVIEENKVVISVIDIDRKSGQIINPNKEKYIDIICQLIRFYQSHKYSVELISFCKSEGDEDAIKEIINNCLDDSISIYYYDGNIDEALNELASAKIIVGTRFHANILGFILNKTVLPIVYNDKTRELLRDIEFKGKYIDLDNIDEFDVNSLTDKDLEYKINVDKYRKDALKHFEKLDQVLERR